MFTGGNKLLEGRKSQASLKHARVIRGPETRGEKARGAAGRDRQLGGLALGAIQSRSLPIGWPISGS